MSENQLAQNNEMPWLPLELEKHGLILYRLRLKGGFNLVDRMWREYPSKPFQHSVFLEGIIDTEIGLEWGEDVDVRKSLPAKEEKGKQTCQIYCSERQRLFGS